MKILMVSPYFLPYLGVGGLRMSSFAKHLVAQNDEVTVLKLANSLYPEELKGDGIVGGINYVDFDINEKNGFKVCTQKMYNVLDKLLNKENYDVIICSCGPFYTMTAVERASKEFNIPYVLDYRDLWIYDDREIYGIENKLRRQIFKIRYKKYEKLAVENADIFVTVTPLCLDIMKKKYKIKKADVIYNGYDDDSFVDFNTKSTHVKNNSVIELCFFGKLSYYSMPYAKLYLMAVKDLIEEGYNIVIKHINEIEESTQQILREINFPIDCYICTGRTSYFDGIKSLLSSDICGAIVSYKRGLGTKIFDYIYVNKPIIAVAPKNGDFANLLKKYKGAFVCQNEEDVKRSLKYIIDNKVNVLDKDNKKEIYSREVQNCKLRTLILNELIKRKQNKLHE